MHARVGQVVKKTGATLINRSVPAPAVAEWRGRVEEMGEDIERLVLVCLPCHTPQGLGRECVGKWCHHCWPHVCIFRALHKKRG